MIYEKKNVGGFQSSHGEFLSKDADAEEVICVKETDGNGETAPRRKTVKTVKNRLALKRRRTHAARWAAVCVSVSAVLCVSVFDARILNGRMGKSVSDFALTAVRSLVAEDSAEKNMSEARTLYTLEYADNHDIPMSALSFSDVKSTADESSVSVNGSVDRTYVDGVRFYPITSLDLSSDDPYALNNGTTFTPDMDELENLVPTALSGLSEGDEPMVLILHTHACESYTEYEGMYPDGEATRSEDTSKNMVRVGKEICDTLSAFGVPAVHCTELHDKESFINAYSNSADSVKEYLKKYPSIRFVIDVHRDAVIKDSGESIKAVTDIAGEEYAQLMFVVGTNQLGHNHPGWKDNLSLAFTLQESVSDTYPSLCRSINLRDVPFNQQLSSGYLLLEVGTSANTLDEALRSARAFGENLARVIGGAL